ncbi:hypothetical protein D3C80_1715930 [compost metagenome]
MLLRKGRESFQHAVGNEGRHLPDLGQVVGVLNSVDDEIGALGEDCLGQLARAL